MNTPGQSGVPGSDHYQDLFAKWAADESFPFLWSRDRIEAETTRRIRLDPAPDRLNATAVEFPFICHTCARFDWQRRPETKQCERNAGTLVACLRAPGRGGLACDLDGDRR